jgi:hypothetical protein
MQYYRTTERTFSAGDHPSLKIGNRSGELVIIGEDRADIAFTAQMAVQADSESAGNEQLDRIQIPMNEADGRVEIGPPNYDEAAFGGMTFFGIRVPVSFGFGTRIDMQVRVPRHCAVEAAHRSGALRIAGLRELVNAENRSGRVEIRDIEGNVRLESRSGVAELRDIRGNVDVESRSGKVEVENVDGTLRLGSRSGSVTIRKVTGPVTMQGRSGKIRLDDVAGPIELSAQSGMVEFRGRVQQPISIEVTSGTVRLAVSRDSSFYMDAEARVGSVRSELPVGYLERPPEDAPTVRVRTQTGSIRVVAL